ncbi:MAG: sodium:proton antiporter [Candidatus Bipolaricaulia bacterium]
MFTYLLAFVLFAVGLYSVINKRNLIKIIMGIIIMEHAVNAFLILVGYRISGKAPILDKEMTVTEFVNSAVDPLPQALVITSIVISLGVVALMVALAVRLYQHYGTFDITEIRKLRG